jgi:hypothetical protein
MTGSRVYRSRALGLLLVSVLATAACGSTVQQAGSATVAGAAGFSDGTGSLGGGDGSAVAGVDVGSAGAAVGSAPGPFGGTGGTGGTGRAGSAPAGGSGPGAAFQPGAAGKGQAPATGAGSPGTAAAPPAVHGSGVTATSIFLGIPYCSDCSSANAALGAGGEDYGDPREYYKVALADVNDRGGVLGRKLVPVWHEISASQNIDASSQAMCETFFKDNKVLMVFMRGEIVYECAKKAGAIVSGGDASGPVFDRYPNMFAPATIRHERLGAVTVKAMVKAGWHKPEPKWPTGRIGLITWDNNDYKYAMATGWLPALKESGLKAEDVRYIAVPQSDKSLADASAAISSAVLAFREKGIDHVFIADGAAGIFTGTGLTFMFLQNAKSQQYYPRYGFNSNNSPGWANHPADQQSGMLAVDSYSTERINDEGMALNPERERCWAMMKKKGLRVTDAQPTGVVAIAACSTAWFAEALLTRATSGTTLPQLIAAGESLGTSYRSPYTYGTRLMKGQHDGTSLFRNARYDDACKCMKYSSKPYEP